MHILLRRFFIHYGRCPPLIRGPRNSSNMLRDSELFENFLIRSHYKKRAVHDLTFHPFSLSCHHHFAQSSPFFHLQLSFPAIMCLVIHQGQESSLSLISASMPIQIVAPSPTDTSQNQTAHVEAQTAQSAGHRLAGAIRVGPALPLLHMLTCPKRTATAIRERLLRGA
ncbi:hypothetical protein FB451DRAFT_1284882 [Mycena latifolia]|nr:hypothetical protein FB451DRAFT_1284882 [Mycena latifolia]